MHEFIEHKAISQEGFGWSFAGEPRKLFKEK
jgi:hypothetical protein